MARSAGYIVGPAVAGWLLLTMSPVNVFTIIGLVSCLAFVPILLLGDSKPRVKKDHVALRHQIGQALKAGGQTPAIWLSGGLEATMFIALYAIKAFLPIYALSIGISVVMVGLFFAVQEAVHMLLKPLGGRIGDRWGYLWAICLGMAVLGFSIPMLTWSNGAAALLALSALMGLAQALVFPSTVALASTQINEQHVGAGMGLMGTLKNGGKVVGPILGGLLIQRLEFALTFQILGLALLSGAFIILLWSQLFKRVRRKKAPAAT